MLPMLPMLLPHGMPYRHQISTDQSPAGKCGPRIMLPLYPSTPRASRRSGSQWHGSRDTWRPHPAISNNPPRSPRNASLIRNGMKSVSQRRYEIKPCIIRNLVNIGHACPPANLRASARPCLNLSREQDTPDDPMQGNASYMIRPILSVFLLPLVLHSTSTIFSAANNHSLLLPNWLGCLHSFL